MKWLCVWGIHRWLSRRSTFNPRRLVKRCRRCGAVKVKGIKMPS